MMAMSELSMMMVTVITKPTKSNRANKLSQLPTKKDFMSNSPIIMEKVRSRAEVRESVTLRARKEAAKVRRKMHRRRAKNFTSWTMVIKTLTRPE